MYRRPTFVVESVSKERDLASVMRPIFLVVDPPDPEALSTRKLVIESAKYNVLTAFTDEEAFEIAERVPVHGIVLHTRVPGTGGTSEIASKLKQICPGTLLILVSPGHEPPGAADLVVNSHDPIALVKVLVAKFGTPTVGGATRPRTSVRHPAPEPA
jgi:response regulator RpfG family c-di-GMP phosphodiesterase